MLSLPEQKGNLWLTAGRRGRYEAILLDNPNVSLETVNELNPASLLPNSDSAVLMHACSEIIDKVYSSRTDLQDHPLEEEDWTLYAVGSSYMNKGNRRTRYAVVTLEETAETKALPLGPLIALILSYEKRVNVYTNSRYTFLILHARGLIWKERGLLTSNKEEIKHATENLILLEAVQIPLQVAVMHHPGH